MNDTDDFYEILLKVMNNFILRLNPSDEYFRVFTLYDEFIGTISPKDKTAIIEEGYLSKEQENELSLIGFSIILESGLPFWGVYEQSGCNKFSKNT